METVTEMICIQYEIFVGLSVISFDEYFKDSTKEKVREICFGSLNYVESQYPWKLFIYFKGKET